MVLRIFDGQIKSENRIKKKKIEKIEPNVCPRSDRAQKCLNLSKFFWEFFQKKNRKWHLKNQVFFLKKKTKKKKTIFFFSKKKKKKKKKTIKTKILNKDVFFSWKSI